MADTTAAGTNGYNAVVQNQNASTTSTDLPAWYQQYTQNIAGQGMGLAQNLNGQALPAKSTAGLNQDQTTAFDNTRNTQGAWQDPLVQAQGLAGQIAPTSSKFTDYAQGAVGNPALETASSVQPWAQGGQDALAGNAMTTGDNANNWAGNIVNSASGPAQTTAAGVAPYAQSATSSVSGPSQDWTSNFSKYMSPYTSQVTDNIARLGNQNWNNNIMPGINYSMIGSGQFGSTRNADVLGKSAQGVQNDILGQQSTALQAGYGTSAGIFANDANRAQQQQQLQANTDLSAGNLMQGANAADANRILQQQQNLTGANQNAGALTQSANAADAARIQQQQSLQSGAALSGGNLMQGSLAADANRIQQQGQVQAQTALTGGQQATSALNTGSQDLGALAQSYQTLNNTDNTSLLNIGNQQQNLQQTGLDTAFNNANLARTDPWTQLNNAANLANGVKLPGTQTVTTTGQNTTASSGQNGAAPTTSDSTAAALLALAGLFGKTP